MNVDRAAIARARFCLATTGHISSNPRIVKEADALAAAGGMVTLVGMSILPELESFDREIAEGRGWRYVAIDASRQRHPLSSRWRAARRRFLHGLPRALWPMRGVLEGGFSGVTGVLAPRLAEIPADLYLAHNLAALPAAARAARARRARLGFDAEDYHAGELPDTPGNAAESARVVALEDRYLPACDHFTASSPEIAERYTARYRRPVTTVLNVFSLAERRGLARPDAPPAQESLYWFSQTIGPSRGLEEMLEILAKMRARPLLQLRGTEAPGFTDGLRARARRLGVDAQLRFLPRAAAGAMVALAGAHTLGLAIESEDSVNRGICLGNKAFTYLMAGLPVVLSGTQAHRGFAAELGTAARLIRLDDPQAAAAVLDDWLADADALRAARAAAWRAAEERYNWEREQHRFLDAVAAALHGRVA